MAALDSTRVAGTIRGAEAMSALGACESLYYDLSAKLGCTPNGQDIRRTVDALIQERDDWKALAQLSRQPSPEPSKEP